MIPSSPRLVAFAQSECDLTTPIVCIETAKTGEPLPRFPFAVPPTIAHRRRRPRLRCHRHLKRAMLW